MGKEYLGLLIMALVNAVSVYATERDRTIHEGWQFRQGSQEIWHPATVPGCVHLDLLNNHIIEDPFFRLNERGVQWIDKEDWVYQTEITPTEEELAAERQALVFEGLDTYADVSLNGQKLLSADNMHRTWSIDVKGVLKAGKNTLEVYFHSPIKVNMPKYDALPYHYFASNDQSSVGGLFDKALSVFARTAGYEYGWDWGPRLVTSGMWRPVKLRTWSSARIANVWYRQTDVNVKRAKLTTIVEIEATEDVGSVNVEVKANGKKVASRKANLTKGTNKIALPFTMRNPRLWWTNGLGEPYLYDFEVKVGEMTATERVGLRSLRVVNEPDEKGKTFYFELNGQPLYAKGTNWIPSDNFLTRVTDSVYRKSIADAKAVNMNMIRVWAGGIYEDDAFYKYCDEMGILVWQDFMFACSTYPADEAFQENVRQEAIDNVRRLRNHTCLAILAGNNECIDVWYGWGQKKKMEQAGVADKVWNEQKALYYKVLPEVAAEYAPDVKYWPACPWAYEDKQSDGLSGDMHDWSVWHGAKPFESYFDRNFRFVSEFGFQSFPEYESVLTYAPRPEDHDIFSEVMMAHQKGGSFANRRIKEYMEKDYVVPSDFKTFLYVGQILQGDAIKTGMEAFRRNRPFCMGALVWQLNDCWPVASWSSRDYYGRWKALHYFTKQAFDDVLVAPRLIGEDKDLEVRVVSDRLKPARGILRVQGISIDGQVVSDWQKPLTLAANDMTEGATLKMKDILKDNSPKDILINITFTTGGKTYGNIAYPERQKDMHFRHADIKTKIAKQGDGYDVTLTTDCFARGVFLSVKGIDNFFSDNYFDMLPHSSKTIHVTTSKDTENFSRELEVISLGDTYSN